LSSAAIREAAMPRQHPFLAGYELHPELASTNDLGLQRATSHSLPCPYLIRAMRQTRGRGRGTHRWWTTDGALTFSLILDAGQLPIPPDQWPILSLVTGLALAETIGHYTQRPNVQVKWPNDIYLSRRKLGGILIESASGPSHRFVVGIGLNVNNSLSEAPEDISRRATSLRDELGYEHDVEDVLWRALSKLAEHYRQLENTSYPLGPKWSEYCLLSGRYVQVRSGDQILRGLCLGIDERGALLVQTPTGVERCFAGEVQWQGDGWTGESERLLG
jgi:BirA family transcriptional regulator, biotin operon repressor / biotin---[acetyl-CoA-carboxylase] ligase